MAKHWLLLPVIAKNLIWTALAESSPARSAGWWMEDGNYVHSRQGRLKGFKGTPVLGIRGIPVISRNLISKPEPHIRLPNKIKRTDCADSQPSLAGLSLQAALLTQTLNPLRHCFPSDAEFFFPQPLLLKPISSQLPL